MTFLIDKDGRVLRVRTFVRANDTALVTLHESNEPPRWHEFAPVDEAGLEPLQPWDYGEQSE